MHTDDAAAFIVDFLRNPRSDDGYPSFGYDIWLPKVIVTYIREVERSTEHPQHLHNGRRRVELSSFFYEAAWGLCRSGVLRPGIKDARGLGAADGAGPDGYCLTRVGRNWLEDGAAAVFLADPDRLSQMFDKLSPRFGSGFLQRVGGKTAMATYGPYAGTKFALEAVSDSLRREIAPFGVQVVVVEPGAVRTGLAGRAITTAHELASTMTPEQSQRYGGLVQAITAQAASFTESGLPADAVAKVIAKAVTARKPRTRYTVGRDAALLTLLARVLPDRILDRVLAAALRPHFPRESK